MKQQTLEKIFQYLLNQPYREVAQLIAEIQADLNEGGEDKPEVEEVETVED